MMEDFDELEGLLRSKRFLERASQVGPLERPPMETLGNSLWEARHILTHLPLKSMVGQRILEVGAGLGIVSAYLEKKGTRVEAVEPAVTAFGDYGKLLPLVHEILEAKFTIHSCSVEDFSAKQNGFYDLIFSHNALEHMQDLEGSLRVMRDLLAPQGRMVHSCPNYYFSYEPHYGIWMVPFFPRVTRVFSVKVRADPAVWDSLNFVTAGKIKNVARHIGCSVGFKEGTMHEALVRLENDPVFAGRQNGWPRRIHGWLKRASLLEWVRFFPANWTTPMVFCLTPTTEKIV